MTLAAKIMVVEDEAIVALNLLQRLEQLGYEVSAVAASSDEALECARQTSPDLVLMDIRIKGEVDGIDTVARLNALSPMVVIYLTAHSEESTLDRARATNPYGYLLKPFSEREMHATIQMALQRRETEKALSLSEERLRLAMDAAAMGVLDVDAANQDIYLQGRAAALLGLTEDISRLPLADLLALVDAGDQDRVSQALSEDLSAIGRAAVEFHVAGAGTDSGWLRFQARNLPPTAGGSRRTIGVVQDASEARRAWRNIEQFNVELARTVEARTRDLRESMADLDAFNYSVAHDLRAPVRAVIGFTSMILEDHGDALPADARVALDRVVRAGERMGKLIDALLSLARITRVPVTREWVDLSVMAGEIILALREEAPTRRVTAHVQQGLKALADPDLLRIVLENLLRNAWKFTSRHPTATISFGMTETAGDVEYFVRDDGAGFTTEGAANLFHLFHRLHHASEFDGIGIGLVTVQRIVQRHGGRIRAEGEQERGAAFYFTLG